MKRAFLSAGACLLLIILPLASALAASGDTRRVSVDSSGTEGNGASNVPAFSGDGRYVAFHSEASNLVAGDTNGVSDVFVYDRSNGDIQRVSVDSSGNQGNDDSEVPRISRNGRYVVFVSYANNLVPGDTNGPDVFVHDRTTGITERVSVDSNGNEGNDFSGLSSISDNGRYVAFHSDASNLVAGDTNGAQDVFVHDRNTGTTQRVSVDSSGTQAIGVAAGSSPSISGNGRYVAFVSSASNLVAGDTNGAWDIFVHDRATDETERVSVDSNGTEANDESRRPSISGDGRYVAFYSDASNLVAGDSNGVTDVFVHDRSTGTTERVSVDSSGTQGNGGSAFTNISSNGRYVAFSSDASNLVAGDSNGVTDVFVHQFLEAPATASEDEDQGRASKDLAASGATTLQFGRILVTVSPGALPASETGCRLIIQIRGDSGVYGFSLDDTVWDVKIVCDSGEQNLFFAPISVCVRPPAGNTGNKQVFHKHAGSFNALPVSAGPAGYVCGQTRQLSLFTLGELTLPVTGFAPGAVTTLDEQPAHLVYTASDLTLNIPSLGLELDIVGVPQTLNGWDVNWLAPDQAGYLYGTTFPTWVGNSLLTAHVWNADNAPGPFYHLRDLQHGDQFTITAWGSTYTYEVRSIALVSARNAQMRAESDYAMVTLLTCESFNETTGDYLYRRAVQAVLISVD